MFNPSYVNESYYRQIQQDFSNMAQNERVLKAVHAFSDMMDQVDGMDLQHQQQTFTMCLAEFGRRHGWR